MQAGPKQTLIHRARAGDNGLMYIVIGAAVAVLALLAVVLVVMPLQKFTRLQVQAAYALDASNETHIGSALERFKRDHGSYPKSLAALAPQYILRVPTVPGSGRPYSYHSPAMAKVFGAYDVADDATVQLSFAGPPCDVQPCVLVFSQARGLQVVVAPKRQR